MPEFDITPSSALFDQPVHVRLIGLTPRQRVTLHARRGDWQAQAVFEASADGVVDAATQAPVAGDYEGIDPMGLFWSMRSTDMTAGFSRMWGGDSLAPSAVEFRAEADGETIAEGQHQREFLAPGVRRTVVQDDGLRGVLFEPAGDPPYPAVVMVSGSGGGLNEFRAALLAAHGYAALALAYFNYEGLPSGLVEIPLEYFYTAIRWLQTRDGIDPERIAFTGGSRGGELSLLLGATFSEIRAVVAYVPSGYVWGGIDRSGADGKPAWTYGGEPVTYVPTYNDPAIMAQNEERARTGTPIPLTPNFLASLKACPDPAAMTIPVEKTNGAILLISGDDDQMWPSATFSELVMSRLKERHFPHPYEHLRYPGAGHLILMPYVPTTVTASGHPLRQALFAYGGNPRDGAFANVDSWQKTLRFLDANLKA